MIFTEIIELYAAFNKVADEKRTAIFIKHKATIASLQSKLVNKSLMKLEEKVLKDLYSKEIITPKLYIKFMEQSQNRITKMTAVKEYGLNPLILGVPKIRLLLCH